MKRILLISILVCLLLCTLVACDNKTIFDKPTIAGQDTLDGLVNGDSNSAGEPEKGASIDVFEYVTVDFKGWNGAGTVEVSVSQDDPFITEHVNFHLEQEYDKLWNEDKITLIAECDEAFFNTNGYRVSETSKSYWADGLAEIEDAQAFHDDVAWVFKKSDNVRIWVCCDTEGNILFELPNFSTPTTHFEKGVAIVDSNKIIDKSGNVVWSIEQHGQEYANGRWGEGSVTLIRMPFDSKNDEFFGYTYVKFLVETYEMTAWMTGILDQDGNWYLEPTEHFDYGAYEGDGLYNYSGIMMYSIWENDVAAYDDPKCWEMLYNYRFQKHGGLVFDWKDTGNGVIPAYCNPDWEVVIDLSRYEFASSYIEHPQFNEGYALLEIVNPQGSHYYTIIDTEGNEMFPPKKSVKHGDLRFGLYWVKDEGYYNVHGEYAFGAEWRKGDAFSCGLAFVNTLDAEHSGYSSWHFVNTSGEIVF